MPPENDPAPTPTPAPAPTPTPAPSPSDPELGEAGKRALAAERTRAAEAERELAKLREATQSETEKAIERARREASDTVRKEVMQAANRRILTAEIRAAAGGRLADPLDAVRLLDVESFTVNDDGDVDSAAITKALDALLDAKPYLGAATKRFEGSADAGPRGNPDESANVSAGLGRLVAGYSKSK